METTFIKSITVSNLHKTPIMNSKAKRFFCRICWNTNHWKKPSGPPKDLGNSGNFGYGYDEWLRRFEWKIGKYHYSFLEPLHIPTKTAREDVSPGDCDIILYTINPKTKQRFFVGRINPCFRLSEAETIKAQKEYKKRGWVKVMKCEVRLFAPTFYSDPPSISVRFKPRDFEACSKLVALPKHHFIYGHRFDRYAPRKPQLRQWHKAVCWLK